MAVQLNHTIVLCRDKEVSAAFLTEILGLEPARLFGPFLAVETSNGVSLDYRDTAGEIVSQHYAFLVDDEDFDPIFDRIRERGVEFWADPGRSTPGVVNHRDGGRGVYFPDPDGHMLEILTRPYGSG